MIVSRLCIEECVCFYGGHSNHINLIILSIDSSGGGICLFSFTSLYLLSSTSSKNRHYQQPNIVIDVRPTCTIVAGPYARTGKTRAWSMRHSHLFFVESDHLYCIARDIGFVGGFLLCWRCLFISTFGAAP